MGDSLVDNESSLGNEEFSSGEMEVAVRKRPARIRTHTILPTLRDQDIQQMVTYFMHISKYSVHWALVK